MSNGPWTDEENDLIVADYFAMLADDIAGHCYSKAEHRRALLPRLNDRSEGWVEFKHQNISAVLKGLRDPDSASEQWLAHQRGKITRGLAIFENDLPDPGRADLIAITLASALGYLDWRMPLNRRADHPALVKWLRTFAHTHRFWTDTERTQE